MGNIVKQVAATFSTWPDDTLLERNQHVTYAVFAVTLDAEKVYLSAITAYTRGQETLIRRYLKSLLSAESFP